MDVVISQDSLLHAGSELHRALKEAARILKPGGIMSFTDFMQSGIGDQHELAEVTVTLRYGTFLAVLNQTHLA